MEQFLTLMADLDEDSQAILSAWYKDLSNAGFRGNQTPNLPFHISMATHVASLAILGGKSIIRNTR